MEQARKAQDLGLPDGSYVQQMIMLPANSVQDHKNKHGWMDTKEEAAPQKPSLPC
jgi:hypothetical protein